MYKRHTMDIRDVQNSTDPERRSIRVNIRLTPSQNKFIIDHNLSITKVMNEALKQLGYVAPKLEEIPEKDRASGDEEDSIDWGDRYRNRKRAHPARSDAPHRGRRRRH